MWIFIRFFIITKTRKQSRVPWIGGRIKKLVHLSNAIFSTLKEMSHQDTKLHLWMFNWCFCVQGVTMKRMHSIWFQLQDIQEKAQHNDWMIQCKWGRCQTAVKDFPYDESFFCDDSIMVETCHHMSKYKTLDQNPNVWYITCILYSDLPILVVYLVFSIVIEFILWIYNE